MVRMARSFVAAALCGASMCLPASGDTRGDCDNEYGDPPARVAACSKILDGNSRVSDSLTYQTVFSALRSRANAYNKLAKYDLAIKDSDAAIKLSSKFAPQDAFLPLAKTERIRAYQSRAKTFADKGDLDQAIVDLREAFRFGANALALSYRAEIWRYKGETDRAIADFNEALRDSPDFVLAFVGRGLAYEKKGNLGLAQADFERALTFPSDKYDSSKEAQETARARLAALRSGAPQPIIPAAPGRAANPNSLPTPTITASANVSPNSDQQGRRVALVIGNSAYQSVNELANPRRDSEQVARSLRNIGFENVTLVADATREKLIEAIRAFAAKADAADWAVVYYAGHGIEVGGVNYLIPVDAKLKVDRDVQFEAVPLDLIMASVERTKKLKLIMLDACRDNPFVSQISITDPPTVQARKPGDPAGGTRSIGRGLGEVRVSGATLVVFAAKHGQTALDGEGGDSPFAVAFLQRVTTPGVEINKLFRLVRDDVLELTAGRQEPYTYGSLPGREDFFFVAGK